MRMSIDMVNNSANHTSMREKAEKAAVAVLASLALTAAGAATAHAQEGASVNRGACISGLAQKQTDLVSYQAPGQNQNGPLTVVNGKNIIPEAFDGAVGCNR